MLSVSGNQLTSLPDEVTQLPWLQQLLCDNNQIASLPETIGRCRQLTKLYAHKNYLEELPEVCGVLPYYTRSHDMLLVSRRLPVATSTRRIQ